MWSIPADVFHHSPPRPLMGELELGISVSGGKSIATTQYHARALKVIRPHYLDDSGQVYYTIVNPGGGYVGGDAYRIGISVAEGASALITDQSAAKVYRTPDDYVVQNIEFSLAAGAVLEYVPDQLILYRDADFRQRTVVNMHPQASLFLSDIITPGWSPDGGKFLYKQAHLLNEVHMDGEPVLLDNLRINPLASDFGEVQDFFMDGRTHVATAICFDPGITPELNDVLSHLITAHHSPDGSLIAAVTECDKPGFVLRALGNRTEELHALVLATANLVRSQLRGQGKIHLRKY
ncbi:urease accessory protein UreD [Corynebacterium stationis]|uniref:Urease accessory protein UreD n=1 Tax=Corynebacterium stationis TaxID=1705 RepID=A0A177INF1_9CORY|nr:urease accessory protein UreD [Corynebacterium stationis]OAH30342.1 urease accessory protein UreD [Corynebacterium stationis]